MARAITPVCVLTAALVALEANGQVVISGDVTLGPAIGTTVGTTATYLSPSQWSYWTFSANAGDEIVWGVRRLAADYDPIASVVRGNLEGAMFDASPIWNDPIMGLPLMSYSDDTAPPNLPGPFGDPLGSFTAPATGVYTISVAVVSGIGQNPHEVFVSGTTAPAPGAAWLAVLGLAAARRHR